MTNDNRITLLGGDCLTLMQEIPDKSIDMVLCDLPYGTTHNKWDTQISFELLWEQYKRIVKDNGAIALFCDGMFMADLMTSNRKMWRYNLIWSKPNGSDYLNANFKPLKSHEEIAIFYKKKPTYNKQYWYSKPYKAIKGGRRSSNYDKHAPVITPDNPDGKRNPLSVLNFNYDKEKFHPTQKPVALCEWLIKTYTNEGETVLDNCCGAGSTGVACMNTNRRFIGIELDEKYLSIAKERLGLLDAEETSIQDNSESISLP